MKRKLFLILLLMSSLVLFSCSKEEKKPFGAENINYDDIEKLSKDGPVIESEHKENAAPFSPLVSSSEVGPLSSEDPYAKKAPVADKELDPDYGGIPIVTKETSRVIESESNESE
jgi:hypothetical protein